MYNRVDYTDFPRDLVLLHLTADYNNVLCHPESARHMSPPSILKSTKLQLSINYHCVSKFPPLPLGY